MRKLRIALTAVATASMVLGTMGAAMAAQSSGQWETRADFIFQLDKALNIQPVYPATPDFQDVPTTDPYYGYIEAAFQDGITNGITQGVFGPSLALTRAEAAKYLVIAFGAGSAAQNITSTSFADNANIPTALVGYVGEAAALGLLKGFPDGNFHPDSNLTTVQEGYLISQLTTAMSSLSLKVSASASDVAPGQMVTLATSGTTASGTAVASPMVTYSVTGTNAADALVSGNTFVGSAAGNYTVQAASGTATATTQISVYGAAAGLKVSAPTSIVANGASTATATVSVVDANGNVVADNTDPITLNASSTAAAGYANNGLLSANSPTVDAVNGVATFTLTAGTVAGASETLTAFDATLGASADQTATVSGAAQVPTSIAVSAASPYLTANGTNGSDAVSAQVLDQTGNPMLSGAYTVSFSVSGPATFSGSTTAAGVYYGPSAAAATATLGDVQGSTGAVTVTASGTGLTSATASVTAVIAGAPSQIAVSAAQTVASGTTATYTATLEDSHGYPVDWPSATPASISVANSDGTSQTVTIAQNTDSNTFAVTETVAGSYTLTASDTTDSLTSGTSTLTVTPGAAFQIVATPGTAPGGYLWVPVNSPTFTVSAQLEDTNSNSVSEAGVPVTFDLTPGVSNAGTATIGGSATGTVTVNTNASGVATATVSAEPYQNDTYKVSVSGTGLNGSSTPTMKLGQNVTASSSLSVTTGGTAVSSLVAGGSYTGTVSLADKYGNAVVGSTDSLTVTLGGTGTAEINGSAVTGPVTLAPGATTFTITPELAGPLTISVADANVYNASTQTSSYSVTPGTNVASVAFTSGGTAFSATSPLSVTAGTEDSVTVSAVDAGGNVIVAPSTIPVTLDASQNGEFRLSASGTDINTAANTAVVDIPAGQTSATFYFVPSTTGTVNFGSSAVAYAITTTASDSTGALTNTGTAAAPVYTEASASTAVTVTYTFKDASGAALSGVAVTFSLGTSGNGTLTPTTTAITNASGQVTATFTTPAGWTTGGTNSVTATVQGSTSASGTLKVTINQ